MLVTLRIIFGGSFKFLVRVFLKIRFYIEHLYAKVAFAVCCFLLVNNKMNAVALVNEEPIKNYYINWNNSK